MPRAWVGFFVRGFFALTLSIGLFLPDTTAKLAEVYIGFFFFANGTFTLKRIRQSRTQDKGMTVTALVSLLGGIAVLVMRVGLPLLGMADIGKYLFAPIAIIIGLFQILGLVQVTPEFNYPLVRRAHLSLGILEVLLGVAIFIFQPIDWQVKVIAHAWIIIVMMVMLFTAYHIRKFGVQQQIQPSTPDST